MCDIEGYRLSKAIFSDFLLRYCHAVIGETATIGNDVSILHGVTLGGTGKVSQSIQLSKAEATVVSAVTSLSWNSWKYF